MKRLLLAFLTFTSASLYSQDLTNDQIQHLADTMLMSSDYKVKIKKVSPTVNNMKLVVVELPYREFPSILLFSNNPTTNKWTRVFEGLSPGIQEATTDRFNWHKANPSPGKDFATSDTANNFTGTRVKQLLDAVSINKAILIPYQNFYHLHSLVGDPKAKPFAPYTIDKTKYRNFGNQLFKNKFDTYSKKDCSFYNSPAVEDASLEFKDNKFVITAKTDNKQQWTYTFDKADADSKFLENKTIMVEISR